jgi:hypothetical protein
VSRGITNLSLADRYDRLEAQWGLLRIEIHHARRVCAAANRLLDCLNEFAAAPSYCAEWAQGLEDCIAKWEPMKVEELGE